MIKPGEIVTGVQVVKSDNCGDDSGQEGYDITVMIGGKKYVEYIEYYIEELEDRPKGIYKYDGEKFIQTENWEF